MGTRLQHLLKEGGEMGNRVAAYAWATTPLGPIASWGEALQITLGMCLLARTPTMLTWGPEHLLFYNDAAISLLGPKHPHAALGLPILQVYREVADVLGPIFANIWTQAQPHVLENQRFFICGQVPHQELYIDVSYVPVLNNAGLSDGILLTMLEKTDGIIGPRRARILQECSMRAACAGTVQEAYKACFQALAEATLDVPVALLYTVNPATRVATLIDKVGTTAANLAPTQDLAPKAGSRPIRDPWAFTLAAHTRAPQVVQEVGAIVLDLPSVLGLEAPHTAVVTPLTLQANSVLPDAFLVAMASPLQPLDENYKRFFALLSGIFVGVASTADALARERQRGEELEELNRVRTAFFTNVSHEFRTPLTLMLGPTEEALMAPVPSLCGEKLDLVHRNQVRLLKLVNALLDFNALEHGGVVADLKPTDLSAQTIVLASSFESLVERAGLKLIIDCPPLTAPVWVDRDMWDKIILNLMSNAFKYTSAGSISVTLRRIDDNIRLQVTDTGRGIPENALPHLFDRFYRVAGSEGRTHEGTGIGLALVREFAVLHQGTVDVDSAVGRGSTFTVTLPTGRHEMVPASATEAVPVTRNLQAFVQEAAHWEQASDTAAPSPQKKSSRPTILLADDNPDMRTYIASLLDNRYNVTTAASGTAALAAIRERRPDLLLSDVMMPGMTGFEVLKALRDDPALCTLPVILLSARAGEEATVDGLSLRADDYLVKPFVAKELLARIESQLAMVAVRQRVAVQETKISVMAALVRARDEFLCLASHELNTPLTSLMLQVETAQRRLSRRGLPTAEVYAQQLETTSAQLRRLGRLIDDMLDIARIDSGRLTLKRETCDLGSVTREVLKQLSERIEQDLPPVTVELPPQPVVGQWDRYRCEQVLANLLTNAARYGEGKPVHIALRAEGACGVVEVQDQGQGVAPEDAERIFERFERAESGGLVNGLGLGLFIVKQIVGLHKGTVHVDSPGLGCGSTFVVRLPLAP